MGRERSGAVSSSLKETRDVAPEDELSLLGGQPGDGVNGLHGSGVSHWERVIGSHHDMLGPKEPDEEGERCRVMEDGVVVEPSRQLEWRCRDVLGRKPGDGFKAALHATQLVREETAPVHHAHNEARVALESTA